MFENLIAFLMGLYARSSFCILEFRTSIKANFAFVMEKLGKFSLYLGLEGCAGGASNIGNKPLISGFLANPIPLNTLRVRIILLKMKFA